MPTFALRHRFCFSLNENKTKKNYDGLTELNLFGKNYFVAAGSTIFCPSALNKNKTKSQK